MTELEKWRLILGGDQSDGTDVKLSEGLEGMDQALSALYEFEDKKKFEYGPKTGEGGSGASSPSISRWLGDIRKYFPNTVVEVMQKDAMKIPSLKEKMLFEPEILEKAQPDVHLVATLMEMGKLIPSKTKETARIVVKKVVDDLMAKLEQKTISAINGAIDKSSRNNRPKYSEINWGATILKNLKHYQPGYKTIIPERLIGYGKKSKKSLKDIVLCIDQSGSMGSSVVYSAIFGAVMASLPNVKTKMVCFDTAVVDLTDDLKDPVDVLFGVQLGGGTDINAALTYCQGLITKPNDTILIMITDLEEGGDRKKMIARAQEIVAAGTQVICLLSLNDEGAPYYDKNNAEIFASFGIPVFACTPDKFPDLMAAAIQKQDIFKWVGDREMVIK
jgi:Mg-chelatase subunit ChlD